MSGGSYNYLCFHSFLDYEGEMLRMYERLLSMGFRTAADETYRTLDELRQIDTDERLREAWRIIEWRDSSDMGDKQAIEELATLGWKKE